MTSRDPTVLWIRNDFLDPDPVSDPTRIFSNILNINFTFVFPTSGAYPGGMHRMHVHPPSPPVHPPPAMCIPPFPSLKGWL